MRDEVILITGTSRGIGKFLAQYYVDKGFMVAGCSRKKPEWTSTGAYEHFILDVSDERAVVNMIHSIQKKFGRLDALINNAGIASMNPILLTSVESVRKIYDTNVLGTFLLCREAAKLMRKRNYGRIVNFTTVAVPLRVEGEAIYASSKAAVLNLSQILAYELASFGITVNVIGPTPIDTDLIRGVSSEKLKKLVGRQAIKRMGTFEDVANVVDFFLSERSCFVTGQALFLGGV